MGLTLSVTVFIMLLTGSVCLFFHDFKNYLDNGWTVKLVLTFLSNAALSMLIAISFSCSVWYLFQLNDDPFKYQDNLVDVQIVDEIVFNGAEKRFVFLKNNEEVENFEKVKEYNVEIIVGETQNNKVEKWSGRSSVLGYKIESYNIYVPSKEIIIYEKESKKDE